MKARISSWWPFSGRRALTMPTTGALGGKFKAARMDCRSAGWKRALSEDRHLLNGLNVWNGKVTCEPVAQALGLPYTPASEALS